jgi:hypothetical protein
VATITWATLLLLLFGLLQFVLGVVAGRHSRGVGVLFGTAGMALLLGLWQVNVMLVGLGALLSLLAPLWLGILRRGTPTWLHHLIRSGLVILGLWLWWTTSTPMLR